MAQREGSRHTRQPVVDFLGDAVELDTCRRVEVAQRPGGLLCEAQAVGERHVADSDSGTIPRGADGARKDVKPQQKPLTDPETRGY